MAGVQKQKHSGTATPTPVLLRTCHYCHQAKIKCERRSSSEDGPCVRCERLGKQCWFSPARRRPNNARRDSRIEALEARVQQLLGVENGLKNASANSTHLEPPAVSSRPGTPLLPSPSRIPAGGTSSSAILHSLSSTPGAHVVPVDAITKGLLSAGTAEVLLQRFKTALTPHFPFVVVPPHVLVDNLRQEKPLLLLAILAAASSDDVVLQRRLGREFQHCIAGKTVYGDTISFEALQALLVHLAWCQYHPRPRRYTQFLQLAIGIMVDLRLDRRPDTRPWKTRIDNTKATDPKECLGLDEQRAVAGCYYLCSTVSTLLQKLCTFPWTQHIEDCCRSLYQQNQHPTDKYIYHIVQIQHIMEEADAANRHALSLAHASDPKLESIDLPKSTHITQLRTRLESIKETLPFTLMESPLMMMHYHTVMVYLCHTSVCTDAALNVLPTGERWPQWRLDALGTGLVAAKSSLSFFLSSPLGSEMHFNNSEWIQLGFAMTYSARLATLSNQRSIQQEIQHLRRFLGMSDILKDVSGRLRSLSTSRMDDEGEKDVFHNYQQRVERLHAWFESQSNKPQIGPALGNPTLNDPTTFNIAAAQPFQESMSKGQLAWNASQPPQPQENPLLSMDDVWCSDGSYDYASTGFFAPDLIDMGNFGRYFAFDTEDI